MELENKETNQIKPIETTDDMFAVKGTSNIKWFGYPLYFIVLYTYSFATYKFTNCSMFITPISWFFDMIVFYLWHLQAHHRITWLPFNEYCHNCHNVHHHHAFPAKYFYGSNKATIWLENYTNEWYLIKRALPLGESKPFESIQNESFGLFMAIGINLIKYYIIGLELNVVIACVIQGLIFDILGNYLHYSFHANNHWLNRFETYKELKYLHYEHHKGDTKRNYAIFFFGLDKMFETYYRTYNSSNKKN